MTPAFARRNEQLDSVAEEQEGDFVTAAGGREGQRAGYLRGKLTFGSADRAERGGSRNIQSKHHCQLALFTITIYQWPAHAVGDIPVDITDLVSGHVFA